MNLVKRTLLALEDLLQRSLRAVAEGHGSLRARLRPTLCTHRPGLGCHCPAAARGLHLVHSEGLREGCDFVVDWDSNIEHRRRPQVPTRFLGPGLARLPAGASVHVKTSELAAFVAHVLPHATAPFVLVTGESDLSPVKRFEGLLEHPHILHWFAQNCDVPHAHERLTRLPIGFDNPVYTRLEKRLGFILTMLAGRTPLDLTVTRNDIGDQVTLCRVREGLPRDRPLRVLCTFTKNSKIMSHYEKVPARVEAFAALHGQAHCWFPEHRLRQVDCWRRHGDHAFEACPQGNGMDTFRVWEALFLGTIPIVKTSPLDALYAEYPVVIVDDWREVTPARLVAWQQRFGPRLDADVLERLTNDHWLARIRRAGGRTPIGA
ncbi:MAG: hypothetical protein EB084_04155 [Proteobacteria bacterium]|nr:hypothetical protein [Pseudomonadota bacterium]